VVLGGKCQSSVADASRRSQLRRSSVLQTPAAREQGVDIARRRDGQRMLVEVKGWPQKYHLRPRGNGAGKSKPTQPSKQAGIWFSDGALDHAVIRRGAAPKTRTCVGALPWTTTRAKGTCSARQAGALEQRTYTGLPVKPTGGLQEENGRGRVSMAPEKTAQEQRTRCPVGNETQKRWTMRP